MEDLEAARLDVVQKLLNLSRSDWKFADLYLVTRDLKLQALVGGDVRFGGADDLCSVGRGYDSEHITARFAVLRRDRFEVREPVA